MNAREELNRIKNLYKESNRYMLTLSYEDIGILIRIIDALDKRAKMDKVKYSSLYGKFKGRNNFENVIKILEKEQEKINERNRNEENIYLFEKNLNLVEEIYKAKEILKNLWKVLTTKPKRCKL